jgi:hypothetical protein
VCDNEIQENRRGLLPHKARRAPAVRKAFVPSSAHLETVEHLSGDERDNQEHGGHAEDKDLLLAHFLAYLPYYSEALRLVLLMQKASGDQARNITFVSLYHYCGQVCQLKFLRLLPISGSP